MDLASGVHCNRPFFEEPEGIEALAEQMTRRGFDPQDLLNFSEAALDRLSQAQTDIQWLLDRGYLPGPVIDFVGSHHQLTARQRNALQRSTASQRQYDQRKASQLPLQVAHQDWLFIDGFNLVITLEVALSKSPVILGKDGVYRDLAGLRGTYRLIGQTDEALHLIGKTLQALAVPGARFYLDQPVSNSGRLRQRILSSAKAWQIPVEVELVPDSDPVLARLSRVVTGDSLILDQCQSWFNLAGKIITDEIPDAWVIRFSDIASFPAI